MKTFGLSFVIALVAMFGISALFFPATRRARVSEGVEPPSTQVDEVLKSEIELIQGRWLWTKIESAIKEEKLGPFTVEFMKNQEVIWTKDLNSRKGTLEVNPRANPKIIRITVEGESSALYGIYKLENDIMTLCFADHPKNVLPAEFATKQGGRERYIVVTAERVK